MEEKRSELPTTYSQEVKHASPIFSPNMPVAILCIYTAPVLFTVVCQFELKKCYHFQDIRGEHKL